VGDSRAASRTIDLTIAQSIQPIAKGPGNYGWRSSIPAYLATDGRGHPRQEDARHRRPGYFRLRVDGLLVGEHKRL
jgi:hypothetical protein